jgi:hypothetical protein
MEHINEMTQINDALIKCPKCNKNCKNDDFKSLVENSNEIKKTCIKCRMDTYKNFKKNNPEKFKVKEEKKDIDYNTEYKDYLRCRNCNRSTNGIDDFKNKKSGRITKTCINCRQSVLKSVMKINLTKPPKITLRQRVKLLEDLLKENDLIIV